MRNLLNLAAKFSGKLFLYKGGFILDTEKLEKSLKSIGKKSFVEDYEIYSNDNILITEKINNLSKKYSRNGSTIRVSFADEIFKNGKQKEALGLIINSPRISNAIKVQAKELLAVED